MRKRIALAVMACVLAAFGLEAQAHPATSYVSLQPQVRGLGCLQPKTRAMMAHLTARIGPIEVTSTCGGRHAHNSQHYKGNAIDFRPRSASVSAALAALRSMPEVGGVGSYSGGLIHADVGARKLAWHGKPRRHFAQRHRVYTRYASGHVSRRGGSS